MSFFPTSYDPRDDVIAVLDLAEIDTPDGPARFIIGTDGVFTDTDGNQWVGSQLVQVSSMQSALDGTAPAGSITLSFFQDPNADSLISQIKELGADYFCGLYGRLGRSVSHSLPEFQAPTFAPIQWMQRTMRTLTFTAGGGQDRSITISFEAWAENRRAARRIVLNTEGHAQLIGEANSSLEFIPTVDFEEEKLFG